MIDFEENGKLLELKRIPVYCIHCDTLFRPPLALGMLKAHLLHSHAQLADRLDFSPGYITGEGTLAREISGHGPGILLFSDYDWNVEAHLALSRQYKTQNREWLIIHGGPSVPMYDAACRKFLQLNPAVSCICQGEGEYACADLLAAFLTGSGIDGIRNICYAKGNDCTINPQRPRIRELDDIPSPYLTGEFEQYVARYQVQAVTLETSRGCPYGCAFCDWGHATMQKVNHHALDRVAAEIDWIGRKQIPVLEIADSNFGMFEKDLEIAEIICRTKKKYGFPREFCTNYAKIFTERVIEIVNRMRKSGLVSQCILSVQTHDKTVLKAVKRTNMSVKNYDKIVRRFKDMRLPVTVELMLGLPASTYQSYKWDVQWACNHNLGIYVNSSILLPNTPMAALDYISRYNIKTASLTSLMIGRGIASRAADSIRATQVISTNSFSRDELLQMVRLGSMLHIFYCESICKYIMFYLQWECGISIVDFLEDLVSESLERFPVFRELRDAGIFFKEPPANASFETVPEDIFWEQIDDTIWDFKVNRRWQVFYGELKAYILQKYKVAGNAALDTVFFIQEFIIPYSGRRVPDKCMLDYDFPGYFTARLNRADMKKLAEYPQAEFEVFDTFKLCEKAERPTYYEPHQGHIELSSSLTPYRIGLDLTKVPGIKEKAQEVIL